MNKFIKIFFAFCLLNLSFPSNAWWTQVHPMISHLSSERILRVIEKADLPENRFNLLNKFIDSARDPDHHKKFLGDHGSKARARALNAFNWAIKRYNRDERKTALLNLARSFHYVQDYGDPSKSVDNKFHESRKNHVRAMSENILYNENIKNDQLYLAALNQYSQGVRNMSSSEALNFLKFAAGRITKRMKSSFEQNSNDSRRLKKDIHSNIVQSFALTVAVQNRFLDIFLEEIKKPDIIDHGPVITPAPRPQNDYGSQSAPRPSY